MMSKLLVIGDDPSLRERVTRPPLRRGQPGLRVQVEFVPLADTAHLEEKRPQAVVLDVRDVTPKTMEVFDWLRKLLHQKRAHQLSLMLQVTPRQKLTGDWREPIPGVRPELITSKTSKTEVQKKLDTLLGLVASNPTATAPRTRAARSRSQAQNDWRAKNDRRIDLIFKKRDSSLTADEETELAALQHEADQHLNQIAPLPFEALREFEAEVQKLIEKGS